MKRSIISILAVAALSLGSSLSAYADSGKEMADNTILLPVRAVAIASGWAIGTPIAITRKTANRCIEFTQNFADKIGGKENIIPVVCASVMGVPFGIIVGASEGTYWGGRNALEYGVEKPFSLASFSLDSDLGQNTVADSQSKSLQATRSDKNTN